MKVAMPRDARCFLISRSVPYQLKPLVECPMRGRCTLASRGENEKQTDEFYGTSR